MTLVRVGKSLVLDLSNVVEMEDITVDAPEVRVTFCEGALQSVTYHGQSAQALRDLIAMVPDAATVLGLRPPNPDGGTAPACYAEVGLPDHGDEPPVRHQGH
jgi:hypothetical protein